MLHVGVCCVVVSVPCSPVVTCWERADLLAVVCVVFSCVLSLFQMCPGPHQNNGQSWRRVTSLSLPVKYFYWPFQGGNSFVDHVCVCHAFASVHCCLVVTCWERVDLLALVCAVYL